MQKSEAVKERENKEGGARESVLVVYTEIGARRYTFSRQVFLERMRVLFYFWGISSQGLLFWRELDDAADDEVGAMTDTRRALFRNEM